MSCSRCKDATNSSQTLSCCASAALRASWRSQSATSQAILSCSHHASVIRKAGHRCLRPLWRFGTYLPMTPREPIHLEACLPESLPTGGRVWIACKAAPAASATHRPTCALVSFWETTLEDMIFVIPTCCCCSVPENHARSPGRRARQGPNIATKSAVNGAQALQALHPLNCRNQHPKRGWRSAWSMPHLQHCSVQQNLWPAQPAPGQLSRGVQTLGTNRTLRKQARYLGWAAQRKLLHNWVW